MADLTLLRSATNGGFSYGINRGPEVLLADHRLELFRVLNPDCEVMPDTAAHFLRAGADGAFARMGARTVFHSDRSRIQTDGGRVSRTTGVVSSVNAGRLLSEAAMPAADAIDFITGASCVASRRFI